MQRQNDQGQPEQLRETGDVAQNEKLKGLGM